MRNFLLKLVELGIRSTSNIGIEVVDEGTPEYFQVFLRYCSNFKEMFLRCMQQLFLASNILNALQLFQTFLIYPKKLRTSSKLRAPRLPLNSMLATFDWTSFKTFCFTLGDMISETAAAERRES